MGKDASSGQIEQVHEDNTALNFCLNSSKDDRAWELFNIDFHISFFLTSSSFFMSFFQNPDSIFVNGYSVKLFLFNVIYMKLIVLLKQYYSNFWQSFSME